MKTIPQKDAVAATVADQPGSAMAVVGGANDVGGACSRLD